MGIHGGDTELTATRTGLSESSMYAEYFLIVFSIIGTIGVLGLLMVYSHYGFDFTDESFYLVWGANPGIYDWSLSQFGFIYHPFYLLFGGDIAQLRQMNVLIIFCLSWLLVDTILKETFSKDVRGKIQRLAISFGFASGSLIFFSIWLPSPSYNSLNLQALLIVATGLFTAQSIINKESVTGWMLIGFGGWLAFMAKPSSAAALGVCVFFYLLFSRKINFRLMILCSALVLLLSVLSALLIDGSVMSFVARLQTAMVFVDYLGGGHTLEKIIRLDDFLLTQEDILLFRVTLLFSLLVAFFLYCKNSLSRFVGLCCSCLILLLALVIVIGKFVVRLDYSNVHGLLILAIPSSMFLLGICLYRQRFLLELSLSRWLIALMFALFPHIYAFGTNNNYWQVGSSAGFFWLLGGLALIAQAIRGARAAFILLPLVLATQLIVVVLVQTGMELPYRQTQPLRLNSHTVEVGRSGSSLVLSEEYAVYLTAAKTAAGQAGFQPGTPVIDLSGQSAGILYAMGATNIGQAWTIGGYPGSFKLASEALKKVSCDQVATAWLLIEPDGPRSISDNLVSGFGADISLHYEIVASWETAKGAGGYDHRPAQKLLKPVRSANASMKACIESRDGIHG